MFKFKIDKIHLFVILLLVTSIFVSAFVLGDSPMHHLLSQMARDGTFAALDDSGNGKIDNANHGHHILISGISGTSGRCPPSFLPIGIEANGDIRCIEPMIKCNNQGTSQRCYYKW